MGFEGNSRKYYAMIINRKPEPNKDVKVCVMYKGTKKMAAGIGIWDGESWKLHTPFGYAQVPMALEVLGWEEK